jgi:hypothetical protein
VKPVAAKSSADRRLARVTKICLALPETSRDRHGSHAGFLVRKKIFAYYLDNHHGDGMVAIACKVLPGDNTVLAAADPDRFYLPAYIGSRGWVALRMDLVAIDWDEVAELILGSYRLLAPKRLAATVKLASA